MDSVIVGAHSCLDSDAGDSETSETDSSDGDYVKELGDSQVIRKLNGVAETLSIDNSSDSDSSDVDEDGNS